MNYPQGYHRDWEDAYRAYLYNSFDELMQEAEGMWLSENFGTLNWPVWIGYDEQNEREYDVGPTISVGLFMPRHGNVCQHISPATPAQVKEMEYVLLRVWGRRADVGFRRHSSGEERA